MVTATVESTTVLALPPVASYMMECHLIHSVSVTEKVRMLCAYNLDSDVDVGGGFMRKMV